ncbi:MAG: adenylate kinase [Candidatus Hydrogenedentota bacterium]|nr:MAG: adenylate kinase [Candidatus Hydrogenedentota bacterium]
MRLILLGPPGSGKGTQAAVLSRRWGAPHVSTGEIFREAIRSDSELGSKVRRYTETGELVPDEIVNEIVFDRLARRDCQEKGFLLDGFPRTVAQARALDGWLADRGDGIDRVVDFEIGDEELIRRLSGRRHCEKCGRDYNIVFRPPRNAGLCDVCSGRLVARKDDSPESIRRRLEVTTETLNPLRDYYHAKGLVFAIDATGDVQEITEVLLAELGCAK